VEKEMQEARRGRRKEGRNNIYDPGRCPSLRKVTE